MDTHATHSTPVVDTHVQVVDTHVQDSAVAHPIDEPAGDIRSVSFIDSAGRSVTIASPVRRALVVYSQILLAMRAIGVESARIVGLDEFTRRQYADIFPELGRKPIIGKNMFHLDAEALIGLNPQVLISTPAIVERMPGLVAQLEKAGIRIVCLDFTRAGARQVLTVLGRMFGQEAAAEDFARYWFRSLEDIEATVHRISGRERITVYWENTNTPFTTINKKSPVNQILEMAGGVNIARDLVGTRVDPEWVLSRDPDIIFKYPMGASWQGGFGRTDLAPFRNMRQEIMHRTGLKQTRAVKTGRVYILSQLFKTGLFENVATACIAKLLYPDRFRDLNPQALFKEMVERYLRLDFKSAAGVFIYPTPENSPAPIPARKGVS